MIKTERSILTKCETAVKFMESMPIESASVYGMF